MTDTTPEGIIMWHAAIEAAAGLFAFFEANGLWGEFRGLEWVGDREDD